MHAIREHVTGSHGIHETSRSWTHSRSGGTAATGIRGRTGLGEKEHLHGILGDLHGTEHHSHTGADTGLEDLNKSLAVAIGPPVALCRPLLPAVAHCCPLLVGVAQGLRLISALLTDMRCWGKRERLLLCAS